MKLDEARVREAVKCAGDRWRVETLQTAIYVAVGGGLIGRMYAHQPADAYIDTRTGRRPYKRSEIENMRRVLVITAEEKGLDPHHLPEMPAFHNCGLF